MNTESLSDRQIDKALAELNTIANVINFLDKSGPVYENFAPVLTRMTTELRLAKQKMRGVGASSFLEGHSNPMSVGHDDLNSLSSDPLGISSTEISSTGISSTGPFGIPPSFGNGGSLVGPNHPIFGTPVPSAGGNPSFFPGYGGVAGLPVPRFDPYEIVTGTSTIL